MNNNVNNYKSNGGKDLRNKKETYENSMYKGGNTA